MSTTKANNYAQAKKELASIDKDAADSLNENIPLSNKGRYVVILVNRINDQVNHRYTAKINIQPFNEAAYEKIKRGVAHLGYDRAILLHTPEAGEQAAQNQDAIKGREEALEAENARLRQELADAKKPSDDKDVKVGAANNGQGTAANNIVRKLDPRAVDLTGKTEDDLKQFAVDNEIDTTGADGYDELAEVIRKWQANPYAVNLKSLNLEALKEFAAKHELDITGLTKKAEILASLEAWQQVNPQADQEEE